MYADDLMIPVFKFLLCIGFVFLIGAIINIIIDKKKGLSNQNLLKKRDISKSDIDTLIISLDNLKGYKKVFTHNNYLIVITEYAINAVLVCDYYGILLGNESDRVWNLKNGKVNSEIENPLIKYYKYLSDIEEKLSDINIKRYILLGGNSLLRIPIKNIKVIRRNNIFYTLSIRKDGKIYTPEEVDEIYKKINM